MAKNNRLPASYIALRGRIRDLYRQATLGKDDRAQLSVAGYDVRVRQIREGLQLDRGGQLEVRYRYVLEFKVHWESRWRRISVVPLTERLYAYEEARRWAMEETETK